MTVVAHPLSGSEPLPVAPAVLAAVVVALVAVVATRVRSASGPPPAAPVDARGDGRRWTAVTRAVAALLLLLFLSVARFGPPEEPFNLASVAAVNLVWPLLLVLAALLGPVVWRAVDPWRALASVERLVGAPPPAAPARAPRDGPGGAAPGAEPVRAGDPALPAPASVVAPAVEPADPAEPAGSADPAGAPDPRPPARSVLPGALLAAAWGVFLVEYAVSLPPRPLATALAAYTLLLVAGSLALGRDRWLGSADAIGLLVTWTGRVRRGGLRAWSPPPAAAALLGAAFGGIAFARVRLTSVWGDVAISDDAVRWTRLAAVAAVGLGALLATLAARWARARGAPGSVEAALVPVVAALAVATVLRRAMVAAQLLPPLVSDPFGKGWRLLGSLGEARAPDLNPWGTGVQQGLAAGLVALGALAGAWVLARRVRGVRTRDPAAFALYVATGLAVLAVTVR